MPPGVAPGHSYPALHDQPVQSATGVKRCLCSRGLACTHPRDSKRPPSRPRWTQTTSAVARTACTPRDTRPASSSSSSRPMARSRSCPRGSTSRRRSPGYCASTAARSPGRKKELGGCRQCREPRKWNRANSSTATWSRMRAPHHLPSPAITAQMIKHMTKPTAPDDGFENIGATPGNETTARPPSTEAPSRPTPPEPAEHSLFRGQDDLSCPPCRRTCRRPAATAPCSTR